MTKAKLGTYSEEQIGSKLQELPGWYYEDGWIRRQYKTEGWSTTLMLVNLIGYVADRYSFEPLLIGASLIPLAAMAAVLVLVRNTDATRRGILNEI